MKNKIPFLALLILLLGSSACNKEENPDKFKVGKNFDLKLNECKIDQLGNLDITLAGIQEGRCPCFAMCIWEGEALLDLEVKYKGNDYDLQISTLGRTGRADTLGKYVFQLVDLNPSCPNSNDVNTDVENYEVELVVERL